MVTDLGIPSIWYDKACMASCHGHTETHGQILVEEALVHRIPALNGHSIINDITNANIA